MHSMTGYGAGSAPLSGGQVHVEVRSLNHKHQDLRLRVPQDLGEHAFFLEQMARAGLGRGRYDLSVRVDGSTAGQPQLDEPRLRALYAALAKLRDELAPGGEVPLAALLSLPDVIKSEPADVEGIRTALTLAFEGAKSELFKMRAIEGGALFTDLVQRLSEVRSLTAQVKESAGELVEDGRRRLRERVTTLLEGQTARLSEERLEQEIALLADKSDITEELVRLESHFAQFEALLGASEPVGRRLDFLLQEISREVNTIGSKSQFAKTAHLVVEMKSEVERLREQVQNVD